MSCDLHRQLPRGVSCRRCAVVQENLVVLDELVSSDVATVRRPEAMVRSASQFLAVREAESENGLHAVVHYRQRLAGDHTVAGFVGRRAVGVDANVLAIGGSLVQLFESEQS